MRCDRCQGTGWVFTDSSRLSVFGLSPCPNCIGGVASCCEAHDEPDEPDDATKED